MQGWNECTVRTISSGRRRRVRGPEPTIRRMIRCLEAAGTVLVRPIRKHCLNAKQAEIRLFPPRPAAVSGPVSGEMMEAAGTKPEMREFLGKFARNGGGGGS
jgi:hypothetical protein